MEQTRSFEIKDSGKTYQVKARFHLQVQGNMPTTCQKCWKNHDGFVRFIFGIEIFDPETSELIRNNGLQKRIAARINKMDLFKPVCGPCLEAQLDDELSDLAMRIAEQEKESQ